MLAQSREAISVFFIKLLEIRLFSEYTTVTLCDPLLLGKGDRAFI
jgi:hypothetical protein